LIYVKIFTFYPMRFSTKCVSVLGSTKVGGFSCRLSGSATESALQHLSMEWRHCRLHMPHSACVYSGLVDFCNVSVAVDARPSMLILIQWWWYILTRDTVRWREMGRYSVPLDERDVRLRVRLHKKILGVQEGGGTVRHWMSVMYLGRLHKGYHVTW
jgi:hypothetical protein